MFPRFNHPALLFSFSFLSSGLVACDKSTEANDPNGMSGPASGGGGSESPGDGSVEVQIHNTMTGAIDPRFDELPEEISVVELPPNGTLEFTGPTGTGSIEITVGGQSRVDGAAPFLLTEAADGSAADWPFEVGTHDITVTAYASADGSGDPLGSRTFSLTISAAGTDSTPDDGEHQAHLFWLTSDGEYVTRTDAGAFVNAAGTEVIGAGDVDLVEELEEQGKYITKNGKPTIDFAFQVLLPDGYDPAVKYPVLLFLHHGWDVYRGTDNDGRPLETPLFDGDRSITSSATRHSFPAVIVVPQHIETVEVDGVQHEWAAFTAGSISNATGDYEGVDSPSISAAFTFKVMDELLSGDFKIDGSAVGADKGRVYIAGHSMGGLGTWDFIRHRPTFFAAAVPMAGYADHDAATSLVDQPIWAFHHENDCYNPPIGSATMLEKITEAGGTKMKRTELTFDTGGACDQAHFQTPGGAWNDEEGLFEWIFNQSRSR